MAVLVVTAQIIEVLILIPQMAAAVAVGMAAMVETLMKMETKGRAAAAVAADILDKEGKAFNTVAAVAADYLLTVGVRKNSAQMHIHGMVAEEPG